MCTIVDLKATKEAKRKGVCSAWRVHRIEEKGTSYKQKTSPWQYTLIQGENKVDNPIRFTSQQGQLINEGAFHCARTRNIARKLKKWLISSYYGPDFVIEKVFFNPADIIAVGNNSISAKKAFEIENEVNENICVSRFVLNEKDK